MARLHEYQGKTLLKRHGIAVPRGGVAASPDQAQEIAARLLAHSPKVILKVQAWVTGRASQGGVVFASSAGEARSQTAKLLSMKFGNFPVSEVLLEEVIEIKHEIFVSLSIDDALRAPVLLLDFHGGSGIEDRAATVGRIHVDIKTGVCGDQIRGSLADSRLDSKLHEPITQTIIKLVDIARQCEARSLEINPLVVTKDNQIFAADCRITIDDYAVFRHPELNIEIARELDHPPTELERVAYRIEQADHRGTFYFAQLPVDASRPPKNLIGFHGAGGGGSMMSMDAVTNAGFTIANFCDTSGNPSAAKVYRAARIILSQPNLVGYFGSGSGVASQEQFWSAYGLAKAFIEMNLDIPAVIRLGGNSEERAVEILTAACKGLPAVVEGYKKDDSPAKCAARFAELVAKNGNRPWSPRPRKLPAYVGKSYSFPIGIDAAIAGRVWIDRESCDAATTEFIVKNSSFLLKADVQNKPTLAVTEAEVANKDSELLMLEIECRRMGKPMVFVDLPITGIDDVNEEGHILPSVSFTAAALHA